VRPPETVSRYRGLTARLATRHGKGRALGPPLARRLGLRLDEVAADTDALGTFAGDVARPGPAAEVVLAKARLALAGSASGLALASEGSYGPDPVYGFAAIGVEHVAFVDDGLGLALVESAATHDTNFAHAELDARDEAGVAAFLARVAFPSHAVLVRAAEWRPGDPFDKGVDGPALLRDALERYGAASPSGRVRLDADMRAHVNPTRMRAIRRAAVKLAARLACACPACAAPGFGRVDVVRGLACEDCGTPTGLVRAEVWGCGVCGHRTERPRADGRLVADPGECPACNP